MTTDVTDRIAAWEAKQRARLAWAVQEIDRARLERIAALRWADRCWNRVQQFDALIARLERFCEVSQDDELIRAKLVIAQSDARRAWITAVRADFRVKRADNRLRRATVARDEAIHNLGLIER